MKASDKQVGGNHYKDFPIQPAEFYTKNKLGGLQSAIVARICRYDKPTGKGLEDLEKIKHEVDLIIEWEGWKEEEYWLDLDERSGPSPQTQLHIKKEPKLQLCKCGETPYINWGNGHYWIQCPSCYSTGDPAQVQSTAIKFWNEAGGGR